ncbi:CLUMA_CG000030, isoform A [Clunio marinus]|uniref:CLUMA_CG000030, isoform A n=1 Tax=Clunio marinus TaxID=568069 RepID=A0A1J1HJ38_9DIPT|nr:CLUMA_CG000030, isoform A [Clunio marinus]
MDINEFREFGRAAIDFLADYLENIRERPVLPSVEPGYLHELLPTEMPKESENWKDIMKDLDSFILPGLTHWQSPRFHAFYPSQTSFPAIIGEMISAGLGVVGFSWICSPACTELEVIVMDWLGKFLNLPAHFLPSDPGNGGGIIQGSASEAILVAVLAAREEKVRQMKKERPEMSEGDIRAKLVGYGSIHSNSAIEKSGLLAATKMRLLDSDENSILRGEIVQQAIESDIEAGLIPYVCIATVGTTGTCAFDKLEEIGPICKKYNVWMHIDAAYAGAAFCLPEYAHIKEGAEYGDSINFNLHKWMLVNFDCCAMWIRNANALTESFNVERIYLDHKYQGDSKAPDYRHWQLALGRRFRSLRVWITLRTYGQDYIRSYIRKHISLANLLLKYMSEDERFEVAGSSLALAFFRLKGDCSLSKRLLDKIVERKNIYMIPALFQDKFIIRFVICGMDPQEKDIEYAWNEIKTVADEMFEEIKKEQKEIVEESQIKEGKEIHVDNNNNEKVIFEKINEISDVITRHFDISSDTTTEKTKH